MDEREIQRAAAKETHRQVMLALGVLFLLLLIGSAVIGGLLYISRSGDFIPVLLGLFVMVIAVSLTMNILIHDHRTRYGKE